MMRTYYQRELSKLRDQGAAFARAHPALAPLLSGEGTDPDVERLLEGSAFLSGMIHQRLDDEIPEFIHAILQMLAPHYLRPIPAMTIMAFTPRKALRECLNVPRGTTLDSVPVEGTICTFSTCYDVMLAPLSITGARLEQTSHKSATLRLSFQLSGMPLDKLALPELRIYFAGNYAQAADRFMLCNVCLREVRFVPGSGGGTLSLPPSSTHMSGFLPQEALLPYPQESFKGFRYLQEYFSLPENFLTLTVQGMEQWKTRGEGDTFHVEFHLDNLPEQLPSFQTEHFRLFVTPAVNIFPMEGNPIELDHQRAQYPLRPGGKNYAHFQTYAVKKVTGFARGSQETRTYVPFMSVNPSTAQEAVYAVSIRPSAEGVRPEQWLAVSCAGEDAPIAEVLSTELLCTNADLPSKLRVDDICKATSTSPELASFTNLHVPTQPVQPPLGSTALWRLLSHLYLNYLSMGTAESLKSLLKLYIFAENPDRASVLANINRVESIEKLEIVPAERFVRDKLIRGQNITLTIKGEHFSGRGDMYLFCSLLNVFLSNYAAVNTYVRLTAVDVLGKFEHTWPERLGDRPLL